MNVFFFRLLHPAIPHVFLVRLRALRMPFDLKLGQRSFDKLKGQLSKLPERSAPEKCTPLPHLFAAGGSFAGALEPQLSGNERNC
jgi:hypothetical protein